MALLKNYLSLNLNLNLYWSRKFHSHIEFLSTIYKHKKVRLMMIFSFKYLKFRYKISTLMKSYKLFLIRSRSKNHRIGSSNCKQWCKKWEMHNFGEILDIHARKWVGTTPPSRKRGVVKSSKEQSVFN